MYKVIEAHENSLQRHFMFLRVFVGRGRTEQVSGVAFW